MANEIQTVNKNGTKGEAEAKMKLNANDNRRQCYWRRRFKIVCVERVLECSRKRIRCDKLIYLAPLPLSLSDCISVCRIFRVQCRILTNFLLRFLYTSRHIGEK